MQSYQIIEHRAELPHKQTFKIVLPDGIAEKELVGLTLALSSQHRTASELMFFQWWLGGQNALVDDCWAFSELDGESVRAHLNGGSKA